jgi:predicted HAD superfamily Cof-like phosphohydrolase
VQTPDSLNAVADFHRLFQHPVLAQPQLPPASRSALRMALLTEELTELQAAIAADDLVEVADALCDLQYVLAGAVLEFGLGERFKTLFDEVQRSNMSKACATVAEAEATVAHYQAKGVACHHEPAAGQWLVYRTADRKTLKNVNYSPANLAALLVVQPV